ncbi:transposase, partial [Candidatus Enterovibrio escicola]|uniref:transposase n=3 Tax=Candidatus Enterovibrio escicola TaxID=1927127 RepID=UPI0030DC1417
ITINSDIWEITPVKMRNRPSRLSVSEVMTIVIAFRQARSTGITCIDSSKLQVCHNLRILKRQVFKGTSKRGKGIMRWLYGFKLHFIINDKGGIIPVKVMTANVDYRKPISERADELWRCLYELRLNLVYSLQRSILMIDVCFTNTISEFHACDDIRE